VWVPVVVLLVVAGAYALAAWWSSTHVPRETTVGGVEIGGLSQGEARSTLEDQLGARAQLPVRVGVADGSYELSPTEAGLEVDVDATVDEVLGFSWDPRVVWRQVSGGEALAAVVRADEDALRAEVQALAEEVDSEPVDGGVTFEGGTAAPVEPVVGVQLDVDGSVDAVLADWPQSGPRTDLPAQVREPEVDDADVAAAMESFATPATSAPLVVQVGEVPVPLAPEQVAPALAMTVQDGELVPAVDGEVLKAVLLEVAPQLQTPATNASVRIQGGAPVVVPAAAGVTVDGAQLAAALPAAVVAPDRTVRVEPAPLAPEVTTEAATALGVTEVVSEFSTNLTADAGRTENIQIASRVVNGTLLLPGETFSLNDTLGERTPAKGYNQAPTIQNGRLVLGYGGGVSQVATTLFNGMFFAGLEDVEHKPHSFYISRYPEGREATVNFDNVDLEFKNDSPYGVLIEMYTGGGQVTTRFWSTKVWDIEAVKGERHNIRQPGSETDSDPDCVTQSPQAGFDVDVTRIFSKDGAEVRREVFSTRYNAEDRVTCTG
jgi:vancomycin resistance protein YoaR